MVDRQWWVPRTEGWNPQWQLGLSLMQDWQRETMPCRLAYATKETRHNAERLCGRFFSISFSTIALPSQFFTPSVEIRQSSKRWLQPKAYTGWHQRPCSPRCSPASDLHWAIISSTLASSTSLYRQAPTLWQVGT